MLIELILALIVGVLIGTLTGLLPGLHINLVSAILLSASPVLLTITSSLSLVIFITSLAITHTIIDFIPSIFLGAPNEDTALSILPAHKLLLEGYGYEALLLTLLGGLTALPFVLIIACILILFLPLTYDYVLRIMPIILILLSSYLIISEPKTKKIPALMIFILSGFLGIASLNLNLNQPLLPLFTGLFGASGLIISINQKTKIPEQKMLSIKNIKLSFSSFSKLTFASIITSPFTAILPTFSSSQSALIGSQIIGKNQTNEKDFLFLLGITNILAMSVSFITLYSIGKTRTGAAVAISKLLLAISTQDILIILTSIILVGFIVFFIAIFIARIFSKNINKINYSKLSIVILIILTAFTIYFSGIIGLLIFITSSALGIFCILSEIKRTQLMGCLLIPTIIFYLF